MGRTIYFGVDRPDPWWTESFMENPALIEASLSDVRVTMVIMPIQHLSACCQVHVGACCYVLSCQALNGLTSRGPRLLDHLPVTSDTPSACSVGARG
jgi:hypothetical protein